MAKKSLSNDVATIVSQVRALTSSETGDPQVLLGTRQTANKRKIGPADWLDYATDLYRDFDGEILDPWGQPVFLNMEPLETAPVEWWRDFCCRPCPQGVTPRVRSEARARVQVLGTILRASTTSEAMLWGLNPANENRKPR